MSEETTTPLWRQAMKDDTHPLHRAAWILMGRTFSPKVAARQLSDQRDAIMPLMISILDDDNLFYEESTGGGQAPLNVFELLTEWQIGDMIPQAFRAYRNHDYDLLNETIFEYFNKVGTQHVDLMLAEIEAYQYESMALMATILADTGTQDPQAYDYAVRAYEDAMRTKDEIDVEFAVSAMLMINTEEALPFVEKEQLAKRYHFSQRLQKIIPEMLDDARNSRN